MSLKSHNFDSNIVVILEHFSTIDEHIIYRCIYQTRLDYSILKKMYLSFSDEEVDGEDKETSTYSITSDVHFTNAKITRCVYLFV